jgi:hypothetical protein
MSDIAILQHLSMQHQSERLRHVEKQRLSARSWIPSGGDGLANISFDHLDGKLRPLRKLQGSIPGQFFWKGVFQNKLSMASILCLH